MISLITAAVVFLALRGLMALSMHTIAASLVPFWPNPEDYTSDTHEVARSDDMEVGMS